MDRVNTMAKLEPPTDQSITTLYVGGLTPDMLESDIHVRLAAGLLTGWTLLSVLPMSCEGGSLMRRST